MFRPPHSWLGACEPGRARAFVFLPLPQYLLMPQGGLRAQQFPSPFPRASSLVLFAPLYQWCLFGWKSYMTVARTSLARRSGMGSVTSHPNLPRLSYFSTESSRSWETPEMQANKDSWLSYILHQNWYYHVVHPPFTTLAVHRLFLGGLAG